MAEQFRIDLSGVKTMRDVIRFREALQDNDLRVQFDGAAVERSAAAICGGV